MKLERIFQIVKKINLCGEVKGHDGYYEQAHPRNLPCRGPVLPQIDPILEADRTTVCTYPGRIYRVYVYDSLPPPPPSPSLGSQEMAADAKAAKKRSAVERLVMSEGRQQASLPDQEAEIEKNDVLLLSGGRRKGSANAKDLDMLASEVPPVGPRGKDEVDQEGEEHDSRFLEPEESPAQVKLLLIAFSVIVCYDPSVNKKCLLYAINTCETLCP